MFVLAPEGRKIFSLQNYLQQLPFWILFLQSEIRCTEEARRRPSGGKSSTQRTSLLAAPAIGEANE
jgi:hypothetical protein